MIGQRSDLYEITVRLHQRAFQVRNDVVHGLITAVYALLCTFVNNLLQRIRQIRCIA